MKLSRLPLPLIVFTASLAVYWFTANPLPSGYADSDEIITAGHLFSVAHPPGYGLNVILIGLFQRLLPFLSPAYASNLLAGLLHALTLTLLYHTAKLILPPKNQPWILAAGVLAAGFNGLFWLYSSVIEVMPLADFFIGLILFQAISWAVNLHPRTFKTIIFLALTLGFAIGHFQPLILLAPGLLVLFLTKTHPQPLTKTVFQSVSAIILTAVGFLASASLILPLNSRHQPYSWTFPPGISGWWHMVTRQDYSGAFLDRDVIISNPYISSFNWTFIDRIPAYLVATWNHFAGLPTLLILAGAYYLHKKVPKPIAAYLITSYLVAGLLFGSYVTLTDYDPTNLKYRLLVGTAERQYLMGYTFLIFFFGLGLYHLASGQKLKRLLAVTAVVSMFLANFNLANQRTNSFVYDYADAALSAAKPDSVIICSSDFACFSLYYQSLIEKKRPDVAVLTTNTKARNYFLAQNPQYYQYLYPENPNFTGHLITHNLQQRPVYFCSISQFDIEYYGFDGNPFFAVPDQYLIEISLKKPQVTAPSSPTKLIKTLASRPIDQRDFHLLGFKDYLASYYQVLARYQTKYNFAPEAAGSLDYALYLNSADPRVIDWRLRLNRLISTFAYDDTVSTSSAQYLEIAKQYELDQQLEQAEASARKAHYLNPNDVKPLEYLLHLYQSHDYPLFASWIEGHLRSLAH